MRCIDASSRAAPRRAACALPALPRDGELSSYGGGRRGAAGVALGPRSSLLPSATAVLLPLSLRHNWRGSWISGGLGGSPLAALAAPRPSPRPSLPGASERSAARPLPPAPPAPAHLRTGSSGARRGEKVRPRSAAESAPQSEYLVRVRVRARGGGGVGVGVGVRGYP